MHARRGSACQKRQRARTAACPVPRPPLTGGRSHTHTHARAQPPSSEASTAAKALGAASHAASGSIVAARILPSRPSTAASIAGSSSARDGVGSTRETTAYLRAIGPAIGRMCGAWNGDGRRWLQV